MRKLKTNYPPMTFPTTRMRFNLYLRPDASDELTRAHKAYVAAVEASWTADDPIAAQNAVERTHRAYGAVLLREDRAARPEAYA